MNKEILKTSGPPNPPPEQPTKQDKKAERELQKQCEDWLHHHGYWRLTAENAVYLLDREDVTFRGWFGHLNKPRGNPLMSDLFLFTPTGEKGGQGIGELGRYLCVELKTSNRFQPGQREMIEMGCWVQANTFEEFTLRVLKWEKHGMAPESR